MKELPQDRPYRFRPPTPRRWLTPLLCWLNRAWYLGHAYRIRGIDCKGIEAVVAAVEAGDAVLLAPNHADHADVHVMMEVLTRVRCFRDSWVRGNFRSSSAGLVRPSERRGLFRGS